VGWKTTKNPIDRLAELVAPAVLSGAVGWAAWSLATLIAAVTGAVAAWAIAYALIRRTDNDRDRLRLEAFEPAPIDEAVDYVGELLLDDPLVYPTQDSRVVRLFAEAEPTPGELVARIADFLGDPVRSDRATAEPRQSSTDASEALHAALANIRSSLR